MAPSSLSTSWLLLVVLLLATWVTTTTFAAPPHHNNPHILVPVPNKSKSRIYIILLKPRKDFATMDENTRKKYHASFLPSKERLVASYTTLVDGFAAWLTEMELTVVAKKPGFGRSFPDRMLHPCTTRTPEFLDLRKDHGLWSKSSGNYGKGVIVAVLDSGITTGHPSFSDKDMPPPPSRWKGVCNDIRFCNNKVIGTRSYVGGSVEDYTGHGTHVASTVAGNLVEDASYHGQAAGTASGVAPGAHIAVYKVCDNTSACPSSAVLRGFDDAVNDGADIISMSVASSDMASLNDIIAISSYRAVARGVVVVLAAGNEGPTASSVQNLAPWVITVAAGSLDRSFPAMVEMQPDRVFVEAEALIQRRVNNPLTFFPLTYGSGHLCSDWSGDSLKGRIIVCEDKDDDNDDDNDNTTSELISRLYRAGAEQVVLMSPDVDNFTQMLHSYGEHSLVQVAAGTETAALLRDYAQMTESPQYNLTARVSFNGTQIGCVARRGHGCATPIVSSFSGRGPSLTTPGIIKPDILAPGLNILGASHDNVAGHFSVRSGTSMATPHISGVAALLKAAHPSWSPAAIRSAIMTTADLYDHSGQRIVDHNLREATAYDAGAGHVRPNYAASPGLIYDIDTQEYSGFMCHRFSRDRLQDILSLNCSRNSRRIQDYELNYPNIVLPSNVTSVRRTLTSVAARDVYVVDVDMRDTKLNVSVSPRILQFSKAGDKRTFTVSVHGRQVSSEEDIEGALTWVSVNYSVKSRVIVKM